MTVDLVLPVEEAARRTDVDRSLLMDAVSRQDEQGLAVPGAEPYWHAAIHLGRPEVGAAAAREDADDR